MDGNKNKLGDNQHKAFIIGFVLIFLVIIWAIGKPIFLKFKNKGNNSENALNEEIIKAPSISAENLLKKIRDGSRLFIIDTRSDSEFNKGHIVSSVNLESQKINSQKLKSLEISKTDDIVIVNQGDNLSETAILANQLVDLGFVNAKYLEGGISAWRNRGFSLISGGESEIDKSKVKQINAGQLKEELKDSPDLIQFIDVRDRKEYKREHIAKALCIPLEEIERNQDKISVVKKVVVYGKNNSDSSKAAVILFDLNFFNVYVLEGGLESWKKTGGNIEES